MIDSGEPADNFSSQFFSFAPPTEDRSNVGILTRDLSAKVVNAFLLRFFHMFTLVTSQPLGSASRNFTEYEYQKTGSCGR